ncbi:MAG: ATP-grasp domain-containing protein [Methanosarcinaceae archaeon]
MEFASLDELDIETVKKPFIIKPAVGFFSAGVYKVSSGEEWKKVLPALKQEMEAIRGLFPAQVFSSGKFLLEDHIDGPELAVDAYYNREGKPVVLNILEHLFPSEDDVEDKVYTTSKKTIGTYLEAVRKLLWKINEVAELRGIELRDFPLHLELRVDKRNRLIPLEVNPIRFAGWCTTDIAYYAYGINVHRYFCEGLEPNWEEILGEKEESGRDENENEERDENEYENKEKDSRTYCLLIAKKPDDIETEDIEAFDYEGFVSHFEKPLELRKLDYRQYPVFAFLFTETRDSGWGEIESYLKSDLKEFIRIRTEGEVEEIEEEEEEEEEEVHSGK